MLNFDFYNPTRILFGEGRIADINKRIPEYARVLVLYGGGNVKTTGTLSEASKALGQRTVFEFGGIEANPTYETLIQAVHLAQRENIDFILAIGGGSVIDGSKFVAAATCYAGDPLEILNSHGALIKQALPIGVILTLAATGSEMNSTAVITQKAIKTKSSFSSERIFPMFAILDPTKTFTLAPRQVANGVVDSFVHIVEQYLTYPVSGHVQDRFAESLLQILIELGPKAVAHPEDYEIRGNLMWVATMALNGLIGAGVPHDWATHMIGHELTALYNIDHARTLAIILPGMLMVRKDAKRVKLLQYATRVWGLTEGDENKRIDTAIIRTRQFFESLGVETKLSIYGIKNVDKIVAQLEAHNMVALGEHKDVTLAVSKQVLEYCI